MGSHITVVKGVSNRIKSNCIVSRRIAQHICGYDVGLYRGKRNKQ